MTADMVIVFAILGVSVVLLVTEWIPMEVTALLTLGATAIAGLVTPAEALDGFSNPAVVTVWAVFILSGGLTRTGVANMIGHLVLRLSGCSEALLVVVTITCAGAMSAIMSNVAVAALMMPVVNQFNFADRLLIMRVHAGSNLVGRSLRDIRHHAALGIGVMAIVREEQPLPMPAPDTLLQADDLLLVIGRPEDVDVPSALTGFTVEPALAEEMNALESEDFGLIEAMLSPHTTLAGKTLRELNFRQNYGLNVLAIWREGRIYRADYLRDLPLRFGDALLLCGARSNFEILGSEPDFLVLNAAARERPNLAKAKISIPIMTAVLMPVMMGWRPISLAAVIGAAVIVLTRGLTMEEAYRGIEWKGIFPIAGMLSLGDALNQTGSARFLAMPRQCHA